MQKKSFFLSGLALICALFIFSGCNELVSSLDNPVSSYLTLKQTTTKIYRGQTYKIEYTTISDAKPVFKSADEKIALVDPNTGVITGANKGKTKITVEIPATSYYNAASAEFEVEVDALLSLPEIEKEIAPGATYELGVKSESDGALTYKSSNTKVATVDNTGKVTAVACGDATITVSVAATPKFDRSETAEFTAKVRISDFATLKKYCTDNDEPYVVLGDDAVINLTGELNLVGKKTTEITCNKEKPATIVLTNKSITIDGGLKLSNILVDGDKQETYFVKGTKSPTESKKVESGHYVIKEPIVFDGIKATGLSKAFFADNYDKNYLNKYTFDTFTINDCLIEYKSQSIVPLNFATSMVINFTISNSTFYCKVKGTGNFIAMSGTRPDQTTGYTTGLFVCDHNTFYNLATGSKNMFMNTNSLKGKEYKYQFNSNIFYETSYQKRIYVNITNNKKQLTTDGLNTYLYDGGTKTFTDTDCNGDEGLQTDPGFADAAHGDFTLSKSSDQYANKTGDPRWR